MERGEEGDSEVGSNVGTGALQSETDLAIGPALSGYLPVDRLGWGFDFRVQTFLACSDRAMEHDDDARSVSSVASYLDAVNPPLTARLPPAVRARSHAVLGRHRAPPSDRRLSQLEQQLHELEMEDWRTDRLIDSGPHDKGHYVWKPELPPRKGEGANALSETIASNQARTIQNESRIARLEAQLKAPGVMRNSPQPAHRTWSDAEQRITRNSYRLSIHPSSRLCEASKPASQSFGSPFSPSDVLLQSPANVFTRSDRVGVHVALSSTPLTQQTKSFELSAIRADEHERSAASRLRESNWQRDPKYLSSPFDRSTAPALSPLKDETGAARAAINFSDFKYASSPSQAPFEVPSASRPSLVQHPVNNGHVSSTVRAPLTDELEANAPPPASHLLHVPGQEIMARSRSVTKENKADLAQQVLP